VRAEPSDAAPGATSCLASDPSLSGCGPSGKESCCAGADVPGGMFYRSYDAVIYPDEGSPASVSHFRLDRFEVTVGRFRQFVGAVVQGWRPAAGSGKHAYLNDGQGLGAGGIYETGWDAADWNGDLAPTVPAWTSNLSCNPPTQTWTSSPGSNETRPIDCITWFEAYAFCIWDGGFLPSEAEWNYAAAGGGGTHGQRVYPWSSPSTDTTLDCMHANYGGSNYPTTACQSAGPNDVGSESPAGDGAFTQADLAGNVWEWNLDWYASDYVTPCDDCADLTAAPNRVLRGGSFRDDMSGLYAGGRWSIPPGTTRYSNVGVRCARAP
jgi:formylglycine-generating enzyme